MKNKVDTFLSWVLYAIAYIAIIAVLFFDNDYKIILPICLFMVMELYRKYILFEG